MRTGHWIGMLGGIVLASLATQASAQTSGQTFHWLGDVTNGANSYASARQRTLVHDSLRDVRPIGRLRRP